MTTGRLLRIAAAALFALATTSAEAQMVVNPNIGEAVDAPFYQGGRHSYHAHRHHDRYAARHPRIVVLQSAFPTPLPFGWLTCCT